MKGLRFRPGELRRSEVPHTNLLPGAGQQAELARAARRRRWLMAGLVLALLLLVGLSLLG